MSYQITPFKPHNPPVSISCIVLLSPCPPSHPVILPPQLAQKRKSVLDEMAIHIQQLTVDHTEALGAANEAREQAQALADQTAGELQVRQVTGWAGAVAFTCGERAESGV